MKRTTKISFDKNNEEHKSNDFLNIFLKNSEPYIQYDIEEDENYIEYILKYEHKWSNMVSETIEAYFDMGLCGSYFY